MAKLTSEERNNLPDSSFAYIDADGGRHYPIENASHVRNAWSRIRQHDKYWREATPKVKARAKELGIDLEADHPFFRKRG